MKNLLLACSLIVCASAAMAADTKTLVDTAKAAKVKRKASSSRVLTNADVKKSKGKLGETKLPPGPIDTTKEESLVEKQETMRKVRAEHSAQLAAAEAAVARLEKEVASLEQQYYDENDLDLRDRELVQRFNEKKKALDAARAELVAILDRPLP
ncbi:MAG: hypothetical protein M3Q69_18730 [Acidobacteriota bacterium]|nr:hypothetical protein [Acidobacteriota bacterium]